MTEPLHPPLPRRYRLAWMLLWFALLGALLRFQASTHEEPVARAPTNRPATPRDGGGIDADRHRTDGGAVGTTAFRER